MHEGGEVVLGRPGSSGRRAAARARPWQGRDVLDEQRAATGHHGQAASRHACAALLGARVRGMKGERERRETREKSES